ncbi:MAG: copper ion binding protein [Thermodesulfovibrionales bacterium]
MAEKTIKIEGMSCMHCVANVKKALEGVEGVSDAKVEIGSAKVKYDEAKVKAGDLEAAVKKAGYKVAD